jgi:protein-disulfide isomerase
MKRLLIVFIPLMLLAGITLFIRIVQYKPLFPELTEKEEATYQVPIFPEDPILGDKKSPLTLIAFEDFGCETCKKQSEIIDSLQKSSPGTFKVIWKTLSTTRFPQDTTQASYYGYCANKQNKFSEFKNFAFENFDNLSDSTLKTIAKEIQLDEKKLTECLNSAETSASLENNKTLAKVLGIQQLPTMFVANKQISLPQTEDEWKTFLGI